MIHKITSIIAYITASFILSAFSLSDAVPDRLYLPCIITCNDNSRVQMDYTETRDQCREYAAKNGQNSSTAQDNRTSLVALFSDCMQRAGWDVPGPNNTTTQLATAGPLGSGMMGGGSRGYTPPPPQQQPAQRYTQPVQAPVQVADVRSFAQLSPASGNNFTADRSAECAFARQASDVSVVARQLAHECDLECTDALRDAPGSLRPPACPVLPR